MKTFHNMCDYIEDKYFKSKYSVYHAKYMLSTIHITWAPTYTPGLSHLCMKYSLIWIIRGEFCPGWIKIKNSLLLSDRANLLKLCVLRIKGLCNIIFSPPRSTHRFSLIATPSRVQRGCCILSPRFSLHPSDEPIASKASQCTSPQYSRDHYC